MIEPETIARYQRELRAMVRAATHDPEAFAAVVKLLDETDRQMTAAARKLSDDGFSWSEIGRALGIGKAGAHHRYAVNGRATRYAQGAASSDG